MTTETTTQPTAGKTVITIPFGDFTPRFADGPATRIMTTRDEDRAIGHAIDVLSGLTLGAKVMKRLQERLDSRNVEEQMAAVTDVHQLASTRKPKTPQEITVQTANSEPIADFVVGQSVPTFHASVPEAIQNRLGLLVTINYGVEAINRFRKPLGPIVLRALQGGSFDAKGLQTLDKAMEFLEISVTYFRGRMREESVAAVIVPIPDTEIVADVTDAEPPIDRVRIALADELTALNVLPAMHAKIMEIYAEQGIEAANTAVGEIRNRRRQAVRASKFSELMLAAVAKRDDLRAALEEHNLERLEANLSFFDRLDGFVDETDLNALEAWMKAANRKLQSAATFHEPLAPAELGEGFKPYARVMRDEPRAKTPAKDAGNGKKGKGGQKKGK